LRIALFSIGFPLPNPLPRLLVIVLLLVTAGCDAVSPPAFSSDIDHLLADGGAYARSLVARPAAELTEEEIISLGYLERARLGVGSPFRLISFARGDERLGEHTRERLSYALLGITLNGRGYQIDAAVLDVLQMMGAAERTGIGARHLTLIERVVSDAPSATTGERVVRLGYMLAGMEHTIDANPDPVIGYVAALVADRRRAREDAVELLHAAAQARTDPLELLESWRREFRLQVEAPAMAQVSASDEIMETYRGTQVANSLRNLALRLGTPTTSPALRSGHFWRVSWLSEASAARLLQLAAEQDYPAQAPISVAVTINRDALLGRPGMTARQRERRLRFVREANNEEKLVAGAALLTSSETVRGPRLSLIVLQSSVFMRGWNQEEPWFPGDPAPSSRDLESRFGLASVTFHADVPEAWRPYYRRMLARALSDLQRVLPTASLRGLAIRIGPVSPDGSALALHDPRTRTLVLPPESSAGTIAHEIAHDLDWQLARKRYNRRGNYATDLAIHRQKGDRLATSLAGLAASFSSETGRGSVSAHERRPAEVFARGMDWLVAAYLSAEGRTGGYLTSFQDAALPGYGTARGPHVDGNAVPALLAILDQIAPVTPEARQWATETHGPARTLTGKEFVRVISTASADGSPFERFEALETARNRALQGLSAESCRMAPSAEARRLVATRQNLIYATVSAAARGIVVDGVRSVAAELEERPSTTALDAFLVWRLDGGPEPADSSVQLLQPAADELIFRADAVAARLPVPAGGFQLNPERSLCGGNPFASGLTQRREASFPLTRHSN
jgi:hypothetical protein